MRLQQTEVVVDLLAGQVEVSSHRGCRPRLYQCPQDPSPQGIERNTGNMRFIDDVYVVHSDIVLLTNSLVNTLAIDVSPPWPLAFRIIR